MPTYSSVLARQRTSLLILTVIALAALSPARAWAIDDPSIDYFTLETPHFYVHYYEGMEDFAHKVAVASEEAHQLLVPLLDWEPEERTHVVINDRVDTANGSATVYGRNHINIYAMPPEADSVLGFYDDWIRILVYHEYVHILHLDTILGIAPYINAVIGQQLIPNQTMPRWYIEGLATHYESSRTRGGRVDSTQFQMWLRMAALDGKFYDIGTATGLPATWPLGSTPYLYGGFFLDYIDRETDGAFATRFNHVYGSRLVPWSMNQIASEETGKTFVDMWAGFTAEEQAKAQARRVAVVAAGRTNLEFITHEGGETGFPRPGPARNEITFYLADLESERTIATTRTTSTTFHRLTEIDGLKGGMSWTPDGEEIVYARTHVIDNLYRYNDLYRYDTRTEHHHRITDGERAREPAISPDGKRLAYVRNRAGTMELVVRDYRHPSRDADVVVSGLHEDGRSDARWQQISMPRWSPDGSKLAFSWWKLDRGTRDIWIYDFAAGDADPALYPVTDDFALDVDPTFGPDGMLYFASDRTGIFNIYAMDPQSRETWQISNVVGGVWSPAISGDGRWVYVSAYTSDGYKLARFPRPTRLWHRARESQVDPILPKRDYPEIDTESWTTDDYQPFGYLAPLTLQPELGVITSGAGFGATLIGYDPLDRHRYSISGGYTTGPEFDDYRANFGGTYSYRRLPVNLGFRGRIREFPRTRSLFAESRFVPFIERENLARFRVDYPFIQIDDSLSLSLTYEVNFTEFAEEPTTNPEPADAEPISPEQGWFNEMALSIRYSTLDRYGLSISVEDGWRVGGRIGVQDPVLGSDFETLRFTYFFDAFYPNPLYDRHVFALALRGGIINSTRRNPGAFFIGGTPPQDILSDVVFQDRFGGLVVRGYPPNITSGRQYQVGSLEYRFPILDLEHGFGTVPLFFRRLKGAAFIDSGAAFDGFAADATYLTGVGGELLLQTTFAYYVTGNLRLGVGRGLTGEEAITEYYLVYGGGF